MAEENQEPINWVTETEERTDVQPTDVLLLGVPSTGKSLHIPISEISESIQKGQPLNKNTMEEMRALTDAEIDGLVRGIYSHVQLNGYYSAGDTPEPINYYLSDTADPDDGGSVIEVGDIKLKHEFIDEVNVLYFGAVGDGSYDDTPHIKSLAGKYGVIYFPKGTYIISEQINFGSCEIRGDSSMDSIIKVDGSMSGFTDSVFNFSGNTPTYLTNTSSTVYAGDDELNLSDSVTLNKNSKLILYNPTDYSYSNYRPSYREGEILEVVDDVNSSTTVPIRGSVYGIKYQVSNEVYLLEDASISISNLSFITPENSSIVPIRCNYFTQGKISGMFVTGSSYATVVLKNCYSIIVDNVNVQKESADVSGTSYGIITSNCQNITIQNSILHSRRHAITTGGGNELSIVNRFINVYNCKLTTSGTMAFGHHGNAEYCDIVDSQVQGVSMAGRKNKIVNCDLTNDEKGNNTCIYFAEILEPSFDIINCRLTAYRKTNPNSLGIWASSILGDNIELEGVINFTGNTFIYNNIDGTSNNMGVQFNSSAVVENKVSIYFLNNNFISTINSVSFIGIYIRKQNSATAPETNYKNVVIKNNSFNGYLDCNLNYIDNLVVDSNYYTKSRLYGNFIDNCLDVTLVNNTSIRGNNVSTGSNSTNCFSFVRNCNSLSIGGNTVIGGANTAYAFSISTISLVNCLQNNVSNVSVREYNIVSSGNINGIFSHNNTTPESIYTSRNGTIYTQWGGSTTWIKNTNTGNTGWVQISKNATASVKGVVNQGVAVPNGSSVDTLLASLRTAGIIAT